ncbi:GerW family sporulation protein [Scatolibacter rhodanostii]|uniref:GerW family sporulation protein n=1 Tax=Scatolibacter rhodanostii TaxID=2014781 RepID=UPI000C0803AD|nr:GerW family sporulation protein [Scatolibacter rhodanostii]
MSNHQVNDLLNTSMEKIKGMVDASTVIGDPITTPDGKTTIIPVSKVSYGFAGGGSDLPTKNPQPEGLFLGGTGAGITVSPVAFLAITDGNVKVLQVEPYFSSLDRAIEKVPDLVDKLTALIKKPKEDEQPEN